MINNLEQICSLLEFDSDDQFYHLQIIRRRKENPDMKSNSKIIKTYYISSVNYLQDKMEEIVTFCNIHNARACINLNRRCFENVGYHMLRKVTEQIMNKDYKSIRKAYESVCGAHSKEENKKWIIDLDYTHPDIICGVVSIITKCKPIGDKLISTIKTKNGYHLITKPFNLSEYTKILSGYTWQIDIHKDNPTILYIP